jgi:hypothetical protein
MSREYTKTFVIGAVTSILVWGFLAPFSLLFSDDNAKGVIFAIFIFIVIFTVNSLIALKNHKEDLRKWTHILAANILLLIIIVINMMALLLHW